MSEQTTEQTPEPEATEPEATEEATEEYTMPDFGGDEFVENAWQRAYNAIAEHNELANSLKAAETSNQEVITFLADSQDEKVAAYRASLTELRAQVKALDKEAKEYVRANHFGGVGISEEDREKTEKAMADLSDRAEKYVNVGKVDVPNFAETLPDLAKVRKSGSTSTGARAGQGKGVLRMRFAQVFVNEQPFPRFTDAKAALEELLKEKVEIRDIHEAYFEGAGVDSFADAPQTVGFNFRGIPMRAVKDVIKD